MQPNTLIQPDFARRRWIDSDGAAHESPVARRAKAHDRDDFDLQAENPRLVAELIVELERYAAADPVIVIARGERGRPDRIQIDHAGHTVLLTPPDARLAAMALEADPPFEGAWGVAARLREAALRIDFGQPLASVTSGPADPPDDCRDSVVLRTGGWSLTAIGVVLGMLVVAILVQSVAAGRV